MLLQFIKSTLKIPYRFPIKIQIFSAMEIMFFLIFMIPGMIKNSWMIFRVRSSLFYNTGILMISSTLHGKFR